jgi:hypothetical protein
MPLYPLPVVFVILMWLFVFYSTGYKIMLTFLAVLVSGIIVYFIQARMKQQWPFRAMAARVEKA